MALASSGQISIGGSTADRSINLELGRAATATSNLNESALRSLAGVSSGAISLSNFYGKSFGSVAIASRFTFNFHLSGIGGTATARYQLNSNGVAYVTNSVSAGGTLEAVSGEWLTSGSASAFEVYASWSGWGGTITGTTGSWINLGTTREWTLTAEYTYATRDLYVEIRRASSGSVLDSATITFEVDSAP
jgi:hypothetical protein